MQLEIRATVEGGFEATERSGKTDFGVQTSITAKLGNYVVLAAAPGSMLDGDALALAVHVTAN